MEGCSRCKKPWTSCICTERELRDHEQAVFSHLREAVEGAAEEGMVMEYGSFIWRGRCPQCNLPWETAQKNVQAVACRFCHTMFDPKVYGKQEEVRVGEITVQYDSALRNFQKDPLTEEWGLPRDVPIGLSLSQRRRSIWKKSILQAGGCVLLMAIFGSLFWWLWFKLCLCSGG